MGDCEVGYARGYDGRLVPILVRNMPCPRAYAAWRGRAITRVAIEAQYTNVVSIARHDGRWYGVGHGGAMQLVVATREDLNTASPLQGAMEGTLRI